MQRSVLGREITRGVVLPICSRPAGAPCTCSFNPQNHAQLLKESGYGGCCICTVRVWLRGASHPCNELVVRMWAEGTTKWKYVVPQSGLWKLGVEFGVEADCMSCPYLTQRLHLYNHYVWGRGCTKLNVSFGGNVKGCGACKCRQLV